MVTSRHTNSTGGESGFTLIETLVALFLLTLAITAPLSLAYDSLKSARTTETQITVYYLAQEAMEFVKNVRDTNVKEGNDWLFGINVQGCDTSKWCFVDPHESQWNHAMNACPGAGTSVCSGNTGELLVVGDGRYAIKNGLVGGATDPGSGIYRSVRVSPTSLPSSGAEEALVEVQIDWEVDGVPHTYTLSQYIYNISLALNTAVPVCGNAFCELGEDDVSCSIDCGSSGGSDPNDFDADGVFDSLDNCACEPNGPLLSPFGFSQQDGDSDNTGNVCDFGHGDFQQCCDGNCGCTDPTNPATC